ncbi:FAD/NAD(P)-binding domain-containing protein [Saccharata proteae CBS 121410]|uniref:FAD/NAD(P)-binding domain-containing protein n=1 Tax=Saccharata proteae CBS 121410 TaxID=1314787 RepID=A0A6A5YBI4_9PEZI|nr:FAD/NAD(P)-binding domain-containing protein [Saccharata proteae CBS 121410]
MSLAVKQRVAIVGSGWAGFTLASTLAPNKFDITVVSPHPTCTYTPLLASAACGKFAFYLAEEPLRSRRRNINFIKGTVSNVNFPSQTLRCTPAFDEAASSGAITEAFDVPYDKLILAPGCMPNTFGTPGVQENAQFIRTVADARNLRARLFDQLEKASLPGLSDQQQRELLHIIIVGGGPTGIEICAEAYDLVQKDLVHLYPGIADKISIAIHDVAPHILSAYDEKLYEYARERLVERKIDVRTESHIEKVEKDAMFTKEEGRIPCGLVIWATGNKAIPLVESLDAKKPEKGLPRILTDPRLRVLKPASKDQNSAEQQETWPGVYGLGDACDIEGKPLPTTAEVATQKAEYLGKVLNEDDQTTPFKYHQKGMVTYIGNHDGVIQEGEWTGQAAWAAWRQGSLTWTRSWRTRAMIICTWVLNSLFGSEITRGR